MGLAPKQRARLSTQKYDVRCFGACPTFTTGQPNWWWSARKGDRHRDAAFSPNSKPNSARSQSPFLATVFSLSLARYAKTIGFRGFAGRPNRLPACRHQEKIVLANPSCPESNLRIALGPTRRPKGERSHRRPPLQVVGRPAKPRCQ